MEAQSPVRRFDGPSPHLLMRQCPHPRQRAGGGVHASSFIRLAYTQSLHNFNPTLLTLGNDATPTIYIAAELKHGVTHAVNALACAMVATPIPGRFCQ